MYLFWNLIKTYLFVLMFSQKKIVNDYFVIDIYTKKNQTENMILLTIFILLYCNKYLRK